MVTTYIFSLLILAVLLIHSVFYDRRSSKIKYPMLVLVITEMLAFTFFDASLFHNNFLFSCFRICFLFVMLLFTFNYFYAINEYEPKKVMILFYSCVFLIVVCSIINILCSAKSLILVFNPLIIAALFIILLSIFYMIMFSKNILNTKELIAAIASTVLLIPAVLSAFGIISDDIFYHSATLSMIILYMFVHTKPPRMPVNSNHPEFEILIHQLRPHFLFNVLTAIQSMCHGKIPAAEKTIIEISEFLSINLQALNKTTLIPFKREFEQILNYFSLERTRFGNKLNIEYDIRTYNFSVPILSIQSIVENSVKHGIMKKGTGGTVYISVSEINNHIIIVIKDNGVGFDISVLNHEATKASNKSIEHVKKCIEDMCNGTLLTESVLGIGTTTTIIIPKG